MGLETLGAAIIVGLTGASSMAAGAAPFAAAVGAAAVAGAGVGIYEIGAAMSKDDNKKSDFATTSGQAAPTPEASLESAQKQADDRRRAVASSGGQTDVTRGGAMLQPTQTQAKTLLGS